MIRQGFRTPQKQCLAGLWEPFAAQAYWRSRRGAAGREDLQRRQLESFFTEIRHDVADQGLVLIDRYEFNFAHDRDDIAFDGGASAFQDLELASLGVQRQEVRRWYPAGLAFDDLIQGDGLEDAGSDEAFTNGIVVPAELSIERILVGVFGKQRVQRA